MNEHQNAQSEIDSNLPKDVENALELLRFVLDVLDVEVGRDFDDRLRFVIKHHLDSNKMRVATDEQLKYEYGLDEDSYKEYCRSLYQAMGALSKAAKKNEYDDDGIPF